MNLRRFEKKILTVLPRFCRPVKPPFRNLESSGGDGEWLFCWSSDDSSFVAFDSRRSFELTLVNLGLAISVEVRRWTEGMVDEMFPLSVEVCLRPLFCRCRIVFDVRFILPVWIDREILETVGGIGRRVTDSGRE